MHAYGENQTLRLSNVREKNCLHTIILSLFSFLLIFAYSANEPQPKNVRDAIGDLLEISVDLPKVLHGESLRVPTWKG